MQTSYVSKIISSLSNLSRYGNLTSSKISQNLRTKVNTSYASVEPFVEANETLSKEESASYAELMFTTKSNIGWIYGTAMPTGWVLLIVLAIIEIFSMPFIRRNGYFQVNLEILFVYCNLRLIAYILFFFLRFFSSSQGILSNPLAAHSLLYYIICAC
jgi:hypothetical protein